MSTQNSKKVLAEDQVLKIRTLLETVIMGKVEKVYDTSFPQTQKQKKESSVCELFSCVKLGRQNFRISIVRPRHKQLPNRG